MRSQPWEQHSRKREQPVQKPWGWTVPDLCKEQWGGWHRWTEVSKGGGSRWRRWEQGGDGGQAVEYLVGCKEGLCFYPKRDIVYFLPWNLADRNFLACFVSFCAPALETAWHTDWWLEWFGVLSTHCTMFCNCFPCLLTRTLRSRWGCTLSEDGSSKAQRGFFKVLHLIGGRAKCGSCHVQPLQSQKSTSIEYTGLEHLLCISDQLNLCAQTIPFDSSRCSCVSIAWMRKPRSDCQWLGQGHTARKEDK